MNEAWVCGGGGGSGAHVRAIVEFRSGHTYRVEVGKGGAGSSNGKSAEAGYTTRLVEERPGEVWRVLAEAGGGFGSGAYNKDMNYIPGGQGGVSKPHGSHLENNPG
eukprot:CAMPEP_0183592078 /NCGR_PEP_ID=MMETSP0371-20130417/167376_1 /TAXON_ID=268820 /ORGANISM="Peridinium aciculiferum, Strain PAER-2" /LENGTH=105 /DNA_ID=CAMNT_0025803579 /DNA_START=29 /DNA_END=342 /DNA_ORIENTATION=+